MEPQAECMLVLIGATPEGKKELLGFQAGEAGQRFRQAKLDGMAGGGVRESMQSWRELLVDLEARGLSVAPKLATGDGALGFWRALEQVSPATRHQRCTVHETVNVMDKLPKSVQPAAKTDLREIGAAPDRATAETVVAPFAGKYGAKYDKAVACLVKDRDALLAFYDFPAEHWDHLRTSTPIESVFATVRHRTARYPGALSQHTARLMAFKRVMTAAKTWQRLKGQNQCPKSSRASPWWRPCSWWKFPDSGGVGGGGHRIGWLIPTRLKIDLCPVPSGCGDDPVQIVDEEGPGAAARLDDGVIALPNRHVQLVAAQVFPDVLNRVQLWAVGWQPDQRDIVRHDERTARAMPSGAVED